MLILFAHRSKSSSILECIGQGQEHDPRRYGRKSDELVREIARALVDEPAAVEVESVGRDENTVLKLRVAPQDVGKVIGKQGRTARSVRTILGAVSMKLHHRYTLDILEEDDEG